MRQHVKGLRGITSCLSNHIDVRGLIVLLVFPVNGCMIVDKNSFRKLSKQHKTTAPTVATVTDIGSSTRAALGSLYALLFIQWPVPRTLPTFAAL